MSIVKWDSGVVDNRLVFNINNQQVKVNSALAQPVFGNYYCSKNDQVEMTGEIVFNGALQSQITFPVILKMPLVRHANGAGTTDEEYFQAEIQSGIINISGTLERSGDWKVLIGRVNEALYRIGAPFKFDAADITFLV
jgi:hypothetical protein